MLLNDKIGYCCFHNLGSPDSFYNLERCLDFCVQAGVKYVRPAFALQQTEYDNGKAWGWRVDPYKKIIGAGLKVIFGAYPQQLKGHGYDSNITDMIDKAIVAYSAILDNLINNGISPDNVIVEAWNEADGIDFLLDKASGGDNAYLLSHTDSKIINVYLDFNAKLYEEAHKRGFKYMDLCSVKYPGYKDLSPMLNLYNEKIATYSSKPEFISFHPYCERQAENSIPEHYLSLFSLNSYSNLSGIPLSASEFGFPSVEWGHPFSGKYPLQYSRDLIIRQIIIMDYLNVNPIILYSGNTNPDQADANADSCWGIYQYNKSDSTVSLTDLGRMELYFLQSMAGYELTSCVLPQSPSSLDLTSIGCSNFAFEYTNSTTNHKKLFYWNPFLVKQQQVNWNNKTYNLTFSQHVKCITI